MSKNLKNVSLMTHRKKMLSKRVKELLNERNMTLQQFLEHMEALDISRETVKNIYYDRVKDLRVSTALAIANFFDCSINHLIGADRYTEEEIAIIKNYRKCGNHGRSLISLISRYEANTAIKEREAHFKRKIPCLVPLGKVQDGFTYTCCEVVDIETTVFEAYTAIEITTNFYAPVFCKGDRILLEDKFPDNGEIGVFVKEGKGFIRVFEEQEGIYKVKRINSHITDFEVVRADQIDCIGTYVGVVRA